MLAEYQYMPCGRVKALLTLFHAFSFDQQPSVVDLQACSVQLCAELCWLASLQAGPVRLLGTAAMEPLNAVAPI